MYYHDYLKRKSENVWIPLDMCIIKYAYTLIAFTVGYQLFDKTFF